MDWFRLYDSIIDDPKVIRLSEETRWFYVAIMCISSRQTERGTLPDLPDIAIHLRISEARAGKILDTLILAGLIDVSPGGGGRSVHGWDKRQFKTDDATSRWRKYKERKTANVCANVGAPLAQTDQIQNRTETEQNTPLPPKGDEEGGDATKGKGEWDGIAESWVVTGDECPPVEPPATKPLPKVVKPKAWTAEHQRVLDRNVDRFGSSSGERLIVDLLRDYLPKVVAAGCDEHYTRNNGALNGPQLRGICRAIHEGRWGMSTGGKGKSGGEVPYQANTPTPGYFPPRLVDPGPKISAADALAAMRAAAQGRAS